MFSISRAYIHNISLLFLILQNFKVVLGYPLCHIYEKSKIKLDLVGLVSVVGNISAPKSFAFSSLNDAFYITGHVGPGSMSVAVALLKATDLSFARLFASGEKGDAFSLVHLEVQPGLHYLGLVSNTESPVFNAVGASVIREHENMWKKHSDADRVGRDAGREVQIIILDIGHVSNEQVGLKASAYDRYLLGWMPLILTSGVIYVIFSCGELLVGVLVALGTVATTISVLTLHFCFVFKPAKPKVAKDAPRGDCVVLDDSDNNTVHIVNGSEEVIQALFQRKIEVKQKTGKVLLLLAGLLLYFYVIISVLCMPNVSLTGQVFFSVANLIGLVVDMVKASKNGKLGLAKKAIDQFGIKLRARILFRNRTAAVSFVARHVQDCTVLKSKRLLPSKGPVWEKWWELLPPKCKNPGANIQIDTAGLDEKEKELLKTLQTDMEVGLTYKPDYLT